MLVLSRKPGESLVIGGNITVTVVEAKGGRVRIGIDAPRELPVHRDEVRRRIDREAKDASPAATREISADFDTSDPAKDAAFAPARVNGADY